MHSHLKPQTHTFTPDPSGRAPVSHYSVCEKTLTKAVYSAELWFTVIKRLIKLSHLMPSQKGFQTIHWILGFY